MEEATRIHRILQLNTLEKWLLGRSKRKLERKTGLQVGRSIRY